MTVVRYIHQNPLKVMIGDIKYKWSRYGEYIDGPRLVDVNFMLKIFNEDRVKGIQKFIKYNNGINEDIGLETDKRQRITDEEANRIIKEVCKVNYAKGIQNCDIAKRDKYLKEIKEKYSLSIRQIERITGINRGMGIVCQQPRPRDILVMWKLSLSKA